MMRIGEIVDDETVHILLVDDDEVDAEAVMRGFRRQRIGNPFTVVKNGVEALAALRATGEARIPRPFIILLDLNMPKMNGLEFLEALRADDSLRSSVVFMLTTSDREEDKVAAYSQQVAGYLLKARAGEDFINLFDMLDAYWRVVAFPRGAS